MEAVYSSGNFIVDEIGNFNFTGNIIPESWFYTIVNGSGKPHMLAINILADIVYWYRPTEVKDENTGKITYRKKFKDKDFLQKSYADICAKFNCSEKQVREALKTLEALGVIRRHLKAVVTGYGKLPNILFLELIPDVLKKLTYPEGNTCFPKSKDVVPKSETYDAPQGNTITKNTTDNTTYIKSRSPRSYDPRMNVPKQKSTNQFNNFPQRNDYDFEELERRLVKN